MVSQHSARSFGWIAALVGIIAAVIVSTPPADAVDDINSATDIIWDVGDAETNVGHTGRIRALVWDIDEYDGRVYLAGKFLNVYDPDGNSFSQPYLAAFDLNTGAWDPTFAPALRGPAYAIDITDDGVIIAGGEIPGGLQAVDATTGADIAGFSTDIRHNWGTGAVFDLEIAGNSVYLGGRFSRTGNQTIANLARVDLATGAFDPNWVPTAQTDTGTPRLGGTNVFGLAVDQGRDRVYVTGKFGSINDDLSAAYFATLNTTDGALRNDVPQGLPPGVLNHRESFSMWQHDVQFRDDRVYVGGQAHQTLILDASTLAPLRSHFTNRGNGDQYGGGDTQVLYVGRNTVWAGCHCWGALAEYPIGSNNDDNPDGQQSYDEYREVLAELRDVEGSYNQRKVSGAYGIDIETGDVLPVNFELKGQGGAWAIFEDSNGRMWAGGQFTRDSARDRFIRGIVRFSPPGAPDPEPAGPTGFRNTYQNRERLVFNWQRVTNAASYEILQDGTVIGTATGQWFTHRNLPAGTTWTYTVRAILNDGTTTAQSDPITASTNP